MRRRIQFEDSIIEWFEKDWMCNLFPELEERFERRKEYSEFYFSPCMVELDFEKLEKLSNQFFIKIDFANIIIGKMY